MNNRPHIQSGISLDCPEITDQLEAYAIGALDSFDRGVVDQHLRWCPRCRAAADAYEAVASLLPLASPLVDPPAPALKHQLMARVRGDGELLVSAPAPDNGNPVAATGPEPASVQTRLQRWASITLVAPLALALIVMGTWANSMRTDLNQREDQLNDQIELNQALLSGNQVQLYAVVQNCPTCTGNGQLGVSASDDMGMLVGWDFDPNQQHDVWQVNAEGQRKRVCQLHIDRQGGVMQMFHLPEAPSVYSDVHITDEDGVLIYLTHLGNDQRAIDPAIATMS